MAPIKQLSSLIHSSGKRQYIRDIAGLAGFMYPCVSHLITTEKEWNKFLYMKLLLEDSFSLR